MHDNTVPSAETSSVIRKIVATSAKPMKAAQVAEELPALFKTDEKRVAQLLEQLVTEGILHEWPKSRRQKTYWNRDLDDAARQALLEILDNASLTNNDIERALKKKLVHCTLAQAKDFRIKGMKALVAEGKAIKHPARPGSRSARFGTAPPDPTPYLNKVGNEFKALVKRLEKSGVTERDVYEAMCRAFAPAAEGAPSTKTEPVSASTQPQLPPRDLPSEILGAIPRVEPRAFEQALVYIPRLRAVIDASKAEFDRAILALAGAEKLFLHRHVHPSEMSPEERAQMVTDDYGNVYMGVVLRNG